MRPYLVFSNGKSEQTDLSHEGSESQSTIDSKAARAILIRKLTKLMVLAASPPFIIVSDVMLDRVAAINDARDSLVTVLMTGETGTGKELLARAVHVLGPREKEEFVAYNCAEATNRELIKSELFGHRRGSFTGATNDATGVIREANGGTLFLDEIGELPLEAQAMLLRFLQDGVVRPVGAKPIKTNARVIAATNRNLEEEVRAGRFREDLFYRLNIFWIHIPPLRERREEIPHLINHFLRRYRLEAHRKGVRLSDEAMEVLCSYDWPGNVRQLSNVICRLVLTGKDNEVISPERLSQEIRGGVSAPSIPAVATTGCRIVVDDDLPYNEALIDFQRQYCSKLMEKTRGNLTQAAVKAKVDRGTLRERIKKLGIETKGTGDHKSGA